MAAGELLISTVRVSISTVGGGGFHGVGGGCDWSGVGGKPSGVSNRGRLAGGPWFGSLSLECVAYHHHHRLSSLLLLVHNLLFRAHVQLATQYPMVVLRGNQYF
ncbi:hypothetical protein J6590_032575 [Homalodisca vitripennis]|nr:hypothetical protein J6590_032575 [Homalodisca vitripennis]